MFYFPKNMGGGRFQWSSSNNFFTNTTKNKQLRKINMSIVKLNLLQFF